MTDAVVREATSFYSIPEQMLLATSLRDALAARSEREEPPPTMYIASVVKVLPNLGCIAFCEQ
jgi:hypothetical protein